ncbi:MAG: hypothetical protein ACQETH_10965 [Candidatus Rifleibacteriota bacterium]
MKKVVLFLILLLVISPANPLKAQNASYLDSLYQTTEGSEDETQEPDAIEILKQDIYNSHQIVIRNEPELDQWSETWLQAVKEVLDIMPASFTWPTRIISIDPSYSQYEIKYNGFSKSQGEIILGYGSMAPSSLYLKAFRNSYDRVPTTDEKIARFKFILVRGMAYSFMQSYPDVTARWKQLFNPGPVPTKVFGPGQDQNMIVMPGMNPELVDMAFSVALYCSSPSLLSEKSEDRKKFIKDHVMFGQTLSGWDSTPVLEDDDDNQNTGGNTGGDGTVEEPGSRPPPDIPDGDYMPIVTEADVGTAAAQIPQEHQSAPDLLKNAIVEVFESLPKYFSTCTEAIVYVPTTDTEAAFSSEGYIFITQNSWFAPSFVELTDESRADRFKKMLIREMTKRFLYFHPETSQLWQETFIPNQNMYDVYVDLCEATVLYYQNPQWLQDLNPERYSFIKTELMQGQEF